MDYSLWELLQEPFMLRAMLVGLLASVACGMVGVLVVQNRLTFLAGGASHAAYGGIGLSFYFGWPLLPCALLFSAAASMLMGAVSLQKDGNGSQGSSDAAIGVLWAFGMAFGIILIELSPGYAAELIGFLFGSIVAVPQSDLVAMAVFDLVLAGTVYACRQGFWALSLDRDFARTRGVPVNTLYLLLVGLTAVTVVMLIRVVGLILVLALLTIPPHLARRFCRTFYGTMLLASILAFLFCLGGLYLSCQADISSGACIIAVATLAYFIAHIPGVAARRA